MKRALSWFDLYWTDLIQDLPTSLAPLMKAATVVGQPASMALLLGLCAAISLLDNDSARAFFYSKGIIALPVASLIKIWVHRPRPVTYTRTLLPSYSFPSGHAYASLLTMSLIAFSTDGIAVKVLALGFAVLVGVSRIYRGSHFPTDVAGGWLFAIAASAALLSWWS